jgi:hypothetical protein
MFMLNKFAPLHFVLNGMNEVPSTTNREDTLWTILPTHMMVTPTIIQEKRRWSTSNKFNPFRGSRKRQNPLLTSNKTTLPHFTPQARIHDSPVPKNLNQGPKGCQLSNHSEIECLSPTRK